MAVSGRTSPCHETNKSSRLDRERSEPGERFTEPLIVLTRRQFEQHATPSRCHHPRLAYPQIQKALETQHRSIAKLKQIQHPGLQVPGQRSDQKVCSVGRQKSGRDMGQSQPMLEVLNQILLVASPCAMRSTAVLLRVELVTTIQ